MLQTLLSDFGKLFATLILYAISYTICIEFYNHNSTYNHNPAEFVS